MAVVVKSFRVDWDVDTMEAYGVYYCLKVCWEGGYRKIEMEMDSKIVADALNSKKILHNYTSCFIHDAHTLGSLFDAISFSHIRRSANMVAHKLTRLALESEGEKSWFRECPTCVVALIEHEKPCISLEN